MSLTRISRHASKQELALCQVKSITIHRYDVTLIGQSTVPLVWLREHRHGLLAAAVFPI